ncbi:MAG: tRNA (uridine(54)-C5)-methyltransferase TrmA [Cellvibrionaceae bacterium]
MAHQVFPDQYHEQLNDKAAKIRQQFADFDIPEIEIFDSPESHYRLRAEFKVWHEGDDSYYAMYKQGEHKQLYRVDSYPVGSRLIEQLMPQLLENIKQEDVLRRRLFSVEFLTTLSEDAVVTLIYHKPLDEEWETTARELQNKIGFPIIGRARKQKVVLDRDYVLEKLTVADRDFTYQQVETGFTQPNGTVNQKMLTWAYNASENLDKDLLELYCGNGNFTCVLAQQFERVLATEISKLSVRSAEYNFNANNIENVSIARMSSEEFSQAMDKVREFRRLKDIDLDSYDFSTVFVDPPRSGLDDHTTEIVKGFDNILYVSCNPNTLHHNLKSITETHSIKQFAVFDQFPYTDHLECGVLLQKNNLQKK